MSTSCRLRYRNFIKILSGFVFCVVLNLGWTAPGHTAGTWQSICYGDVTVLPGSNPIMGVGLAIANQRCLWPQSSLPFDIAGSTTFISATSTYHNNFSCQVVTVPDLQPNNLCTGYAFYDCPLSRHVRTSDGFCVPTTETNFGIKNGNTQCAGNPVEIGTGRKLESTLDLSSGGSSPLTFSRNYSSVTRMAFAAVYSRMGTGWRSNFDSTATYRLSGGVPQFSQAIEGDLIHVVLPDLNEYSFRLSGGTWKLVLPTLTSQNYTWDKYRTDLDYALTASPQTVELRTDKGDKYTYDLNGRLIKITLPNGYAQSLYYSGDLNTKVIDSFGRSLTFEYWSGADKAGLLKSATGSDGKKVSFDYVMPAASILGNITFVPENGSSVYELASVVYPDATPADDTDNPRLDYEYLQDTSFPYALTAIKDERGVKFASWTYDAIGRAISSQHSGGDGLTTFGFDDANNKVTVTNALGRSTVYTFQRDYGMAQRLVSVDGVTTTNCAASNTAYGFDANGNRNQATDAEGRVTTWTRNARGLPLTTTDGFGTPAARTTTTAWDATRPLPTQIAAPGLTTNLAYNANGVVTSLSQVDTTTTTVPYSTKGQTRTTAFGYTSFTIPAAPVVAPTGTALSDAALTLVNPNAETGTAEGWTISYGTLVGPIGTMPCNISTCFGPTVATVAYQDVPIPSAYVTDVDASRWAAKVAWKQSSYYAGESAALRLVFLDQSGAAVGTATSADHVEKNWAARETAAPLPVGTRTIRVQMILNGGSVDDLALTLVADGTAAAKPFLRLINPDAISGNTAGWTLNAGSAISAQNTTPCDVSPCFVEMGDALTDSFYQTISIPSDRVAEIDAAKRSLELRWMDRAQSSGNQANVEVVFLDATNATIAAGGTTSPSGGQQGVWSDRVLSVDIPALTRNVKITVNFTQPAINQTDFAAKMALTGLTARLVGRTVPQIPVDLLTSVDGPLAGTGDRVVYAYDAGGNLAQITNEVGLITKVVALDAASRPTTTRDANSVDTKLAYDPRGRLTTITVNPGAVQAVTSIAYDPAGDVTKVTRPDGSFLQYSWNDARRLTLVTNNTGESIAYTYNANGDVTSSVVKSSTAVITKQMTLVYDELGRLMKSLGAASQTTTVSYDRTDNPVQVADPRSNLYGYAYDGVSRLVRTTDQGGSQVSLTRDGQDNVVAYADPRALTTTYVRNGFGEVIRETSPDAGVTTYVRNLRGLVTQATDGRGIVSSMTYDNAGRLLSVVYPAATAENVTYAYDSVVAPNKGIGRLTKITDQSGTTEFVYNALGQITLDKRTIAGMVYSTAYVYNRSGHVTQVTYPSGRIVGYARNLLGQVASVTTRQTSALAAVNVATGIAYKPMSTLVSSITHGNGLVTTAGYDLDYRLTSLLVANGATNIASLGYSYGDNMNLTAINDNVAAANNISLWYTPANRLQNASGSWGQSTYYYDAVGNRTHDITTLAAVTKTRVSAYPAGSNRITGMTENGAALRTYAYDGAGNIISDVRPGQTFAITYNKRNRPVAVTRNAIEYATYGYNALQQLVSRSTSASGGPVGTVHYIYDLDGHLIAEANGATGAITRDYIWMAANDNVATDLPLAVAEAAVLYMVHTDHLGRPIRMTDATKATVWQAAYKPWGEPKLVAGSKALNLRFPGQYFQIETGFAYNWNRHYDPVTGRYTQPDPLGFVDGPSVYAYAGSSPFMRVDRDGKDTYTVGVSGTFIAGGGAEIGSGFLANFGNPITNECADFGFYFSGGPGVGLNIGISANAGFSTGSASSIDGISLSGSVGAGYASVSGSTGVGHASSTSYSGGVGVGITPVSANVNASYTYSFTYQKTKSFFNWVFGRATEECSCSK